MRKLISLLLALMIICSAAIAEDAENLVALDYADFTLAIRKDAVGASTDTIENNVPFLTVYQDFDPGDLVGNSLTIAWSEETLDLGSVEPVSYCQAIAAMAAQRYESAGIVVTDPKIYTAELDEMDEKPAVSYMFSMQVDFRGLGIDYQAVVYTLQATAPLKDKGTYTFTITTDDLQNSQALLDIVDSVRWKD